MEYDLFKLTQESIGNIERYFERYIDIIDRQLESAKSDLDSKIRSAFRDSDRVYYYYECKEISKRIDNELRETQKLFENWYEKAKEQTDQMRSSLKGLLNYLENNYLPSYENCTGDLIGISIGCSFAFYEEYDNTSCNDKCCRMPDNLIFVIKSLEWNAHFQDSYAKLSGYGDEEEIVYEELDYEINECFYPKKIDINFKYYNKYGELINQNNRR